MLDILKGQRVNLLEALSPNTATLEVQRIDWGGCHKYSVHNLFVCV
jgi:hypothetical protein